jgi:hypothetical protein
VRRIVIGLLIALAPAAAACGGGDEPDAMQPTGSEARVDAPAWAARLLDEPGPEGAAILATSDFAVGRNRVKFVLVREDGSLIEAPLADVFHQTAAGTEPVRTTARLTPFGVAGAPGEATDVKSVYTASLELPQPGKRWIVIRPRGIDYQAFQLLDVKEEATAVAVGERAPSSVNPTTASEPARKITTARPPDTGLLRHTVADSLARGIPFVVAFATPAFCASRTCGPTVQVVDAVRRRHGRRGIRFIHIEIYEDNLPGNGVNRWVREWRLPSEPWVFVVGADGVVRDRFEGAVSLQELDAAVRRHLTP